MRLVIAVVTLVLAVNALSEKSQWESFKVKFEKSYLNAAEENYRYSIFLNNLKEINEHNEKYQAGLSLYEKGVNEFTDFTQAELEAKFGYQKLNRPQIQAELHEFSGPSSAPDSIDWREKGAVTEVKNQRGCGSCWAFSAVGALEGQYFKKNQKLLSFSEQELVDCSVEFGPNDCTNGGQMIYGFQYVAHRGISLEEDYPYEAVQSTCRAVESKKVFKTTGYKNIRHSEDDLKEIVGTVGPVSVAIDVKPVSNYKSGIFDDVKCVSSMLLLNHGVVVVGYGTENGTDFWIVKNSWGTSWGENGYFRLKRGVDLCGVSLVASYPTV